MRKLLILFIALQFFNSYSYAISSAKDSTYSEVSKLFNQYLNGHQISADDSTLSVCQKASELAIQRKDIVREFQAKQLIINILCQRGSISEGINMAKEMYDRAKTLNNPLSKGLALQAIGATYTYTSQYQQALATYAEAIPIIFEYGDTFLQANLLIHQLYICTHTNDMAQIRTYLDILLRVIEHLPIQTQDSYLFYAIYYETLLLTNAHRLEEAQESLAELEKITPNNPSNNVWRLSIKANILQRLHQNELAINYIDSALLLINENIYSSEYKNLLYQKADLLEQSGNLKVACHAYARADSLTNVLNIKNYSRQIENLRLTYYVDQVIIENTKMRNQLLSNILIYSIIVIVITVLLIMIIRKRNTQLAQSKERLNLLRQEIADSIQSKSMFLSNMSHDLRTPLNAIVGFSEILTTYADIDSEMKLQCRESINQNSALLLKLVNDIVDFSSLKGSKIKFDFGTHDVVALSRNVLNTVENVKQTEAKMVFSSTFEKLTIETDSGRLQQVLINLLTNAAKFTKEGSIRLHLDFDNKANEVIFTVEDTGCGIPLERQARIFERFEKIHESVQGVGLGLSICKLIIAHVNGRIWIDSSYTVGTRFIFTHPVSHTSKTNI